MQHDDLGRWAGRLAHVPAPVGFDRGGGCAGLGARLGGDAMKHKQTVQGYDVVLTCSACPEQYDVYKDAKQVGYLRLRHGYFRADVPDACGETVYESNPDGDGQFTDEERGYHLESAIAAIDAHYSAVTR